MFTPGERVHMVGIGGYGMSAVARVLIGMGVCVSGSDLHGSALTQGLEDLGARIYIGEHRPENLKDAQAVIYSSAITGDNPELKAARERHIPVYHRSEALASLMNSRRGIAVAGAHGKTTVTSMVSWILQRAGLDPTVLIGGELAELNHGAKYGQGAWLVAEADESDGSFLRYRPEVAVVTNIEADHLENYGGNVQRLVETFERFLHNVRPGGAAVLCQDDPELARLAPQLPVPAICYSLKDPTCAWYATEIRQNQRQLSFSLFHEGRLQGRVSVPVPGVHNVANSLAALAAADRAGVGLAEAIRHLADFHNAKRRFQVLTEAGGITVVDDYAHHPTEVQATLAAARQGWPRRRLVAVFQPHRYARTHFLWDQFLQAFDQPDLLVLTDIYAPPPDRPIPGVSGAALADALRRRRGKAGVVFVPTPAAALDFLKAQARPGDLILVMGAGDISQVAHDLAQSLQEQQAAASAASAAPRVRLEASGRA